MSITRHKPKVLLSPWSPWPVVGLVERKS
jgi:hypothetical protein